MENDTGLPRAIALIVGLPAKMRPRLEAKFSTRLVIRSILLRQDGPLLLQPQPSVSVRLVEQWADEASAGNNTYEDLLIIALPYARIPEVVFDAISTLEGLGARVISPKPSSAPWPSRSPRLDQKFQDDLLVALIQCIDYEFPEPKSPIADEREAFELLRGLLTHSKLGPNNHSHEDDLWKSRGRGLGPGGKERIVKELLDAGFLGRKQNKSAGGKGWVYWIADLPAATKRHPDLVRYIK